MYFGKEMCHFGVYSEHSEQDAKGGKPGYCTFWPRARKEIYYNVSKEYSSCASVVVRGVVQRVVRGLCGGCAGVVRNCGGVVQGCAGVVLGLCGSCAGVVRNTLQYNTL